jgi:hypothetical protein
LIVYFTCTAAGIFPDTAQCGIEKYFYCQQASGGKCGKKKKRDFIEEPDIRYIFFYFSTYLCNLPRRTEI